IWSYEAPSAQYMLDWAFRIPTARLVEIGQAPGWPALEGRAPVIDFSKWNGERGSDSWNALTARVSVMTRPKPPKKPPPRRAALVLAAVSIAAVAGALFVRVHDALRPVTAPVGEQPIISQIDPKPGDGVGGPLHAVEPDSVADLQTS